MPEDEKQPFRTELDGTPFVDEPVTDPILIAELERRMEEYRRNPALGRPWSEVRADLQARLRKSGPKSASQSHE